MPQMAPMNWLILFMTFMLMLYLLSNMLYFNFMKNKKKINKIKNFNKMKNNNKFI